MKFSVVVVADKLEKKNSFVVKICGSNMYGHANMRLNFNAQNAAKNLFMNNVQFAAISGNIHDN